MQNNLWNTGRVRRLSIAYLIGLTVAAILILYFLPIGESGLTRGDFPAFYSAGKLIWSGKASELYLFDQQFEAQREFWPHAKESFLYFAYPPFVAFALAPLAVFPPFIGKLIFFVLSLLCLWGTAEEIVKLRWFNYLGVVEIIAFLLLFPPLLIALAVGQFTPLLLYLTALSMRLFSQGKLRKSGAALGLLAFKPQFGAMLLFGMGFLGMFKPIRWALLIGVVCVSIGVLLGGFQLQLTWIQALFSFAPEERMVNSFQMTSLINAVESLGVVTARTGTLVRPEVLFLSKVVLGILTLVSMTTSMRILRAERDEVKSFLVVLTLSLTFSLHLMFYDLGLLAIPTLYIISRKAVPSSGIIFGLLWAGLFCCYRDASLPFSPLVVLPTAVLVALGRSQ